MPPCKCDLWIILEATYSRDYTFTRRIILIIRITYSSCKKCIYKMVRKTTNKAGFILFRGTLSFLISFAEKQKSVTCLARIYLIVAIWVRDDCTGFSFLYQSTLWRPSAPFFPLVGTDRCTHTHICFSACVGARVWKSNDQFFLLVTMRKWHSFFVLDNILSIYLDKKPTMESYGPMNQLTYILDVEVDNSTTIHT